jgi:hypothetical protein
MLKGKSPNLQRKGIKLRSTSAHTKATWASDVLLVNHISILIKPYQVPISSIPCKLQLNYLVINPETGFSPITTENY